MKCLQEKTNATIILQEKNVMIYRSLVMYQNKPANKQTNSASSRGPPSQSMVSIARVGKNLFLPGTCRLNIEG